jgi:hypothetical protein
MPAIDPARLAYEIQVLRAEGENPARLAQRALDLLEFYADRTRRPKGAARAGEVAWVLGVPRPVQRTLATALQGQINGQETVGLETASLLWDAGHREARVLAASILSPLQGSRVADWVEARAPACDDAEVLTELAGRGLAGWRAAAPQALLDRIAGWLRVSDHGLRGFAMVALTADVQDSSFEDLPSVFRLLRTVTPPVRGPVLRAHWKLVETLAKRSAPETARYLLDELSAGKAEMARLIRQVLPSFPPRQRRLLEEALSEQMRPGIIPPSE